MHSFVLAHSSCRELASMIIYINLQRGFLPVITHNLEAEHELMRLGFCAVGLNFLARLRWH